MTIELTSEYRHDIHGRSTERAADMDLNAPRCSKDTKSIGSVHDLANCSQSNVLMMTIVRGYGRSR
jgi:hypothetical protein